MSNSEIVDKIGSSKQVWKAIVKTKIRMIEHNLRHSGIISFMLEGM